MENRVGAARETHQKASLTTKANGLLSSLSLNKGQALHLHNLMATLSLEPWHMSLVTINTSWL